MNLHAVNANVEISTLVQEHNRKLERSQRIADATSSGTFTPALVVIFDRVRSLTRSLVAGVELVAGSPRYTEQEVARQQPSSASIGD